MQIPVNQLRQQIGYIFQNIALFPNMTVLENAAIQLRTKMSLKKARPLIIDLLKKVELDPEIYLDKYPAELSGGEQQRVGIVRALAADPDLILMDEPFSALDPIVREKLQILILSLYRDLKKTFIFVTHDMDEALKLATEIGVMDKGQLIQVAPPQELLQHPANHQVKKMFEKNQLVSIADLVMAGFCQKVSAAELPANYWPCKEPLTIREVASHLKQQPILYQDQFLITTNNLLDYLAQK